MRTLWLGYFLVAFSAMSGMANGLEFSNPYSIAFAVIAYVYWTYLVLCLHLELRKKDSNYPFDPGDSMLGAIIPFVYIFWNWFWVSEIYKWLGQSKIKALTLGALVSVLSLVAYPDNLDRLPSSINLIALCGLFATIDVINRKLKQVSR